MRDTRARADRPLGRLVEAQQPTLAGVRVAAGAVAPLLYETAQRVLRDLARRR